MHLRVWWLPCGCAAVTAIVLSAPPALAGWGGYVARSVAIGLVRQAAARFMYKELYRLNGGSQGYSSTQPVPRVAPHVVHTAPYRVYHTQHTAAHYSVSPRHFQPRYDSSLIPPPPPTTYTPPSLTRDSQASSDSGFNGHEVPPPPPAPSLWDNSTNSDTSEGTKYTYTHAGMYKGSFTRAPMRKSAYHTPSYLRRHSHS